MSHSRLSSLALVTISLALLACSGGAATASPAGAAAAQATGTSQHLAITVTADGFEPAQARIKVGQPVTLTVTRKVEKTCATGIIIKDYGVNKDLPTNQSVEVTFTPTKPGRIRYNCPMDMIAGELVAEQ